MMKNLFVLFALLCCVLGVILGCGTASTSSSGGGGGGGGGGGASSIAGSWTGTHGGEPDNFVFTSDGKYTWNSGTTGTWTMNDDLLSLDGSSNLFKVVISGNSMNWYEKDPDGNWLSSPSRTFTKC